MSDDLEMKNVLSAVSNAISKVKSVGKEGENKHDKYNFASIDNFLSLVNPICADTGIIILCNEGAIEDFTRKGKYGDNAWIRATFIFTVYHTSGESLPQSSRTVEVLRNGAQAYGSAQSYALKQFLRSLLLIPTGDKDDADLQATDAGVVGVATHQRQDASTVTPEQFVELRDKVEDAGSDVAKVLKHFGAASLEQFPAQKFQNAINMLNQKIAANLEAQMKEKPADKSGADGIDDEIPNFEENAQ